MNRKSNKRLKKQKNIKAIAIAIAFVLAIIATCFGLSKFQTGTEPVQKSLQFNLYKIAQSEIELEMLEIGDSTENEDDTEYTGEGYKVTISSLAMLRANEGKVGVVEENELMIIQYYCGELNDDGTAGENDSGWKNYNGEGFILVDNIPINARLVCIAEEFYGEPTTVEVTNIAVARIQTGEEGEENQYTYFRTITEAIEQCEDNTQTTIELIHDTTESINIPWC